MTKEIKNTNCEIISFNDITNFINEGIKNIIPLVINLDDILYYKIKTNLFENLNLLDVDKFMNIKKLNKHRIVFTFSIKKDTCEFHNLVNVLKWMFNFEIFITIDRNEIKDFNNTHLFQIMKSLSFIEKYFSNVRDWLHFDIFDKKFIENNDFIKVIIEDDNFNINDIRKENFVKLIGNFYNSKGE